MQSGDIPRMCDLFYFIFFLLNFFKMMIHLQGCANLYPNPNLSPVGLRPRTKDRPRAKLSSPLDIAHNLDIVTFDHDSSIDVCRRISRLYRVRIDRHRPNRNSAPPQSPAATTTPPAIPTWSPSHAMTSSDSCHVQPSRKYLGNPPTKT